MTANDQIRCALCGHDDYFLGDHLLEEHDLTVEQYQEAHPDAPVVATTVWDAYLTQAGNRRRRLPPALEGLTVDLAGVPFALNPDVPESACLPLPANYKIPEHGALKRDIRHAAIGLARNRSFYIWGMPGSGKDAFFHAFSNLARRPGKIFQIKPGIDIEAWFFTRAFDKDGTSWEEGDFLKAARDGYVTETGERVPYLLLITDFDRADRAQAEALRLVMDSTMGRISGPTGEVYTVLPGTVIAATANTAGGGDTRGRMISSNPLDASLMDRFNIKLEFHWMDWKDEGEICQAKYPLLVEKCSYVFGQIGAATVKLREAIHAEELHWEFSHRAVCNWLTHAEDIIYGLGGKVPPNLLKRAARVVLDGAPDEETREGAKKIMDPHITGGALDKGDYKEDGKLVPDF
jgi:MoxR-like ATPase